MTLSATYAAVDVATLKVIVEDVIVCYIGMLLLNMGFTSVYQLGRAGRGKWGAGKTYNLDTENH